MITELEEVRNCLLAIRSAHDDHLKRSAHEVLVVNTCEAAVGIVDRLIDDSDGEQDTPAEQEACKALNEHGDPTLCEETKCPFYGDPAGCNHPTGYRHLPPECNTAAVLHALQTIHDRVNALDENCGVDPVKIRDIARAALRRPSRNCDRMPDIDKLTVHDLAKSLCKSTLECASREELLALVRWLLSLATKQKGDDDGSK